ncbi:MAG TPA: hypothetical protein VMR34_03960 [Candidatus Saccharimonadales bacterium]|jgi:hypothetical protein|nr:hypothetical protein [Candidatus Saccharimonadales bacterium]
MLELSITLSSSFRAFESQTNTDQPAEKVHKKRNYIRTVLGALVLYTGINAAIDLGYGLEARNVTSQLGQESNAASIYSNAQNDEHGSLRQAEEYAIEGMVATGLLLAYRRSNQNTSQPEQ